MTRNEPSLHIHGGVASGRTASGGVAPLRRMKTIVLPVCWLIGLAFAAVSSAHALNYIGHPRSYFFFDTLLPVTLILGLLVVTLRELK